jgi:hypothetical protein
VLTALTCVNSIVLWHRVAPDLVCGKIGFYSTLEHSAARVRRHPCQRRSLWRLKVEGVFHALSACCVQGSAVLCSRFEVVVFRVAVLCSRSKVLPTVTMRPGLRRNPYGKGDGRGARRQWRPPRKIQNSPDYKADLSPDHWGRELGRLWVGPA